MHTLAHRAKTVADPDHLKDDLAFLNELLLKNGYLQGKVSQALRKPREKCMEKEEDLNHRGVVV